MNAAAFLKDLAVLMSLAGAVAVLFSRLRWPKTLGYILAGVLMSAHTWGGAFLVDEGSVRTVGQLGIVFLMFSLGLGFSMSELRRLRFVAFPVALLDTALMTWVGYTIGREALGWGFAASLFLGVAVCDSATTMLAKVIEDMGWGDRPFVKYVIGVSVCEDIICVVLVALVAGVAGGEGLSLRAAGASLARLVVFFLAILVFGLVLVPRLLKSVAGRRDDEALLMLLLGLSFFVSWIALKSDLSIALGAFLVGVIGAASSVRERLSALVSPLRSMFSAVFFVSIGLLVDPAACMANLPAILLISAAVVAGKFIACCAGSLACGLPVRTAVQVGMGLAQIGEFAFMVALLYISSARDSSNPMFQIAVAVSVVTSLLNPLMIRISGRAGAFAERAIPKWAASRLDAYRVFVARYREKSLGCAATRGKARRCVCMLFVFAALEVAVAVALSVLNGFDWSRFSAFFDEYKSFVFCLAFNFFALGVFAPVVRTAGRLGGASPEASVLF